MWTILYIKKTEKNYLYKMKHFTKYLDGLTHAELKGFKPAKLVNPDEILAMQVNDEFYIDNVLVGYPGDYVVINSSGILEQVSKQGFEKKYKFI